MGIKQDLQRIRLNRNHFHIHRRAEETAKTEWCLVSDTDTAASADVKNEKGVVVFSSSPPNHCYFSPCTGTVHRCMVMLLKKYLKNTRDMIAPIKLTLKDPQRRHDAVLNSNIAWNTPLLSPSNLIRERNGLLPVASAVLLTDSSYLSKVGPPLMEEITRKEWVGGMKPRQRMPRVSQKKVTPVFLNCYMSLFSL